MPDDNRIKQAIFMCNAIKPNAIVVNKYRNKANCLLLSCFFNKKKGDSKMTHQLFFESLNSYNKYYINKTKKRYNI